MSLSKIPPPPKQPIPTGFEKLSPNRLFYTKKEIDLWMKNEYPPQSVLIRSWKVELFQIEIAVPEIKSHKKGGKKK
jgi:hypothetical protein